ncbi:MAG: DUF5816 domain-containing protein [Halobacteriaceae archaeon]
MKEFTSADGTTVFVDPETAESGSKGAFCAAFTDRSGSNRYGWYCTNCDSFDTAMDTMGRVECADCGNRRKPDEWDAVTG